MIYPNVNNVIGWLLVTGCIFLFAFAMFLIVDAVRRKIQERRFDLMQKQIEEEFKSHFNEIKK